MNVFKKSLPFLAIAIATLAATGCKWDDSLYQQYVGEKGYTTSCTAYCEGADAVEQAVCTSEDVGGSWIEKPKCENLQAEAGSITDEASCEERGGNWKTGYCVIADEAGCHHAQKNWRSLDYKMMDLGNGQYIIENSEEYLCGTFDDLLKGRGKPCDPNVIREFEDSMRLGLCPDKAKYCVSFDHINNAEDAFSAIQNIGICNSCPQNQIQCDGLCVDIIGNTSHCGGCNIGCTSEELCLQGTCTPIHCQPPSVQCNGQCVDINTDKFNCGTCGKICGHDIGDSPDNYICEDKICYNNSCPKGNYDKEKIKCYCTGSDDNVICYEEKKENAQMVCVDSFAQETCGAKDCSNQGTLCSVGQTCNEHGECECPPDLVTSSDKTTCLNPYSPQTCGVTKEDITNNRPFKQCNTLTESCDGKECKCLQGYQDCGSGCVDVLNNAENCGLCGKKCGEHAVCQNGQCLCKKGYSQCLKQLDGNVSCNELLDCRPSEYPEYCGAQGLANNINSESPHFMGQKCQPNEACTEVDSDTWECGCPNNRFVCNDVCVNPNSNKQYCGAKDCENDRGIDCNVPDSETSCNFGRCECNDKNLRFAGILTTPTANQVYVINYSDLNNHEMISGFECVDTTSNAKCCGDDCLVCEDNKVCNQGQCDVNCPNGMVNCAGNCLDKNKYHVLSGETPNSCKCNTFEGSIMCPTKENDPNYGCTVKLGDNNNCKECGNQCPESFTCMSNQGCMCQESQKHCQYEPGKFNNNDSPIEYCMNLESLHMTDCLSCEEHWGNLDGNWANGCEADLSNNLANCGTVGHDCNSELKHAAGVICHENTCAYTMCNAPDYLDCTQDPQIEISGYENYKAGDGCETNIMNDVNHCARCGNECVSNRCENGVCCYKDDTNIYLDKSKFTCCEGQKLIYKKHIFIFCPDPAHYGCIASNDKMPNSCWKEVTSD